MASEITVKVGPLTSTRTFTDDAKVQDVLLRFAGPPDGLTNQQKLNYVVDRIVDAVLAAARHSRTRELVDAAADTAAGEITVE